MTIARSYGDLSGKSVKDVEQFCWGGCGDWVDFPLHVMPVRFCAFYWLTPLSSIAVRFPKVCRLLRSETSEMSEIGGWAEGEGFLNAPSLCRFRVSLPSITPG